jgi:hypothetical protein
MRKSSITINEHRRLGPTEHEPETVFSRAPARNRTRFKLPRCAA